VLGVYPSALHVRWEAPNGESIGALAVDNEPSVFWNGADQEERINDWRGHFFEDAWGTVSSTRLNGSSGAKLDDDLLAPLGVNRDDVWFTDAVNTYFLKRNESQAKAVTTRFVPFAKSVGLPEARLPNVRRRPSPQSLVNEALSDHRVRLLDELEQAAAPLVVTLGNEALAVAAGLADSRSLPTELSASAYGSRFSASFAGRTIEVLPLKHPGNTIAHWVAAHTAWKSIAIKQ
jgi:hypothetical protein